MQNSFALLEKKVRQLEDERKYLIEIKNTAHILIEGRKCPSLVPDLSKNFEILALAIEAHDLWQKEIGE